MLKLKNINKKLGNFRFSDVSTEIAEGEYYVLLGRSGSGKTQLLELIAGLNVPDSGEIWIDNENVTKRKIQNRNVGLVFQDYAIFPNMTVSGNISYSLHSRRCPKADIMKKVNDIAREFNIGHLLDRHTQNLSGGELQRVALARTLVTSPRLLLLDEPMASVDASLKDDIKRTLRNLNRKGLTIVHVTHDYREAVSLASKIGVIHNGHLIQEGPPAEVFGKPVNRFVARYAGIKNFFRVRYSQENGSWVAHSSNNIAFRISGQDFPENGLLVLRSDNIRLENREPVSVHENCFKGVVKEINPSENGMEVIVDAGEIFYVDLPAGDFKSLRISELSDVWVIFGKEDVMALSGSGHS